MTEGHFGLTAGAKAWAPHLPLWVLMLVTYLLDIIFIVLFAFGIVSFTPIDPKHPASGQVINRAYYTHSLLGALLIAAVAVVVG